MNWLRKKPLEAPINGITEDDNVGAAGTTIAYKMDNAVLEAGGDDLILADEGLGMEIICSPESPDLDIVFVHGLTGGRRSTWTSSNGTLWPQVLLKKDMPNARILSFGYDADIVKLWGMAGSNKLRDHACVLSYAVADYRFTDAARKRPLIFVAHSLGGLVVEQALLLCWKENDSNMNLIVDATTAVVFMGTPHTGSSLAFWGRIIAKYLNVIRRTNKKIIELLEPRSEVLVAVEQDFQRMLLNDKVDIKAFCFYEEQAVTGVGKIVTDESAILPQYSCASIHGNHMTMTKFATADDQGYKSVLGRLRSLAKHNTPEIAVTDVPGAASPFQSQPSIKPIDGGHMYLGTVNSGGGQVIQGNTSATGSITYNFRIK